VFHLSCCPTQLAMTVSKAEIKAYLKGAFDYCDADFDGDGKFDLAVGCSSCASGGVTTFWEWQRFLHAGSDDSQRCSGVYQIGELQARS
jgi:hypothetical protein